jgi:hypothetical protein
MKKELWLRLQRYHFDHLVPAQLTDRVRAAFGGADASTQAFASKVCRKLGWTRPFALRAIHEYKKFVYLGVVSDESVTPPKVIDQVWHEHLLFTRAYRDFCRDVLGRDFDHNPELVQSKSQTELFRCNTRRRSSSTSRSSTASRPPRSGARPSSSRGLSRIGRARSSGGPAMAARSGRITPRHTSPSRCTPSSVGEAHPGPRGRSTPAAGEDSPAVAPAARGTIRPTAMGPRATAATPTRGVAATAVATGAGRGARRAAAGATDRDQTSRGTASKIS